MRLLIYWGLSLKKIILSLSCFLILSTQNLCAFGPLDNPEERHHLTASPRSVHQLKQDAHLHRMKLAKTKESFNQRKGWGTTLSTTWDTLQPFAKGCWAFTKDIATGLFLQATFERTLPTKWEYKGLSTGKAFTTGLHKKLFPCLRGFVDSVEEDAWKTLLAVFQTSVD